MTEILNPLLSAMRWFVLGAGVVLAVSVVCMRILGRRTWHRRDLPAWRAVGFEDPEARAWAQRGFGPFQAQAWAAAGFQAGNAARWSHHCTDAALAASWAFSTAGTASAVRP